MVSPPEKKVGLVYHENGIFARHTESSRNRVPRADFLQPDGKKGFWLTYQEKQL